MSLVNDIFVSIVLLGFGVMSGCLIYLIENRDLRLSISVCDYHTRGVGLLLLLRLGLCTYELYNRGLLWVRSHIFVDYTKLVYVVLLLQYAPARGGNQKRQ